MPFDLNSNPVRITIGAVLLLVGLIAGWFIHKGVSSQPDIVTAGEYDDWRLTCAKPSDKDHGCEMNLDVPDDKGNPIARLTVFKAKEGQQQTMVVMVPYNVLLEPGIGLKFGDDKPRIYPFEVCNGLGCIVRIKFDDSLAKAMSDQSKKAVILVAQLDGKAAGLPFSLKGFDAAHKAYVTDDAKRHSWFRRVFS